MASPGILITPKDSLHFGSAFRRSVPANLISNPGLNRSDITAPVFLSEIYRLVQVETAQNCSGKKLTQLQTSFLANRLRVAFE
jgi:hypothetical protein